ncbi:MAG: FtsX-like permease family protein, partial [Sedimenticolaceae bacterium]|nr:FtsX-like permease family protein [Sedimenticolaceae bacterium]
MRNLFAMSGRMLWRDWRGGELRILAIALVIAVTSVTSVGFFIDRVQQGMDQQASELIAADLVVSSASPVAGERSDRAETLGLEIAETTSFRSVIIAGDQPKLVEAKAVSENYPLRGTLSVSDTLFGEEYQVESVPAAGEAWAEPKLFQELGLSPGDRVTLGEVTLTLTQILTYEPDRGGDFFSVAPRLLFNTEDLAATGLVQTGSLVRYHLLLAGEPSAIREYGAWLDRNPREGERLLTVEGGRPELRNALERARSFLGLAALVSVLLAGVAVATAARRFSQRHLDTSAIMRCMGATQNRISLLFLLEMLWLALLASTLGSVLGYLTQIVIAQIMDQLLIATLPQPSLKPLLMGYVTGIILLLGFAMPPLLALKRVPPLRVLRKDIAGTGASSWLFTLGVLVSMGVLLYWQTRDPELVVYMLSGIVLTLLLLAACARLLIAALNSVRGSVGVAWRFGLANIARRPSGSVMQIVAFGLGIMVLLLLSTVRNDLLDDWQRSLPEDAPNHFLINIQSDQVDGINSFFAGQGVETRIYPMVRARLTKINGKAISTDDYESERAKHLLTREFNLSWSEALPAASHVIEGQWWSSGQNGQPLLSLEEGIGKSLRIGMHDSVTFDINGTEVPLRVTNLRKVDWDSFNVNFFTVLPPGLLDRYPASWVTSIYLDPEQKGELGELVKAFPNVTIIDVGALMTRVRTIMDRVSLAVEFIFLFTLMAGVAVLLAAIQSTQDERRYESAILRTLGAQRGTLMRGLVAEFVTLGALAGLLAGVAATSLAWLFAEQVFKFDYSVNPWIPLVGIVAGILIVGLSGVL